MKGIICSVFLTIFKKLVIGLVIYLIVLFMLGCLNRTFYIHHCNRAVRILRKVLRTKKTHTCILGIMLIYICFSSLINATTQKQGYKYIQTELASQKEVDVLFVQEINDDNKWKNIESFSKLHVEEGFVNAEISQEMFNFYKGLFSQIYKNGSKTKLDGKVEIGNYTTINYIYIQDANRWRALYDENEYPNCFYQWGRALNDAAMTIKKLPFIETLEIAADAISIEEEFLSYYDRNINGDNPLIINAEDVALMNGKLYFHLAIRAEAENSEEKGYANCFLVEAYECIKQGQTQIDMQNDLYALLTYYLGNIGETILWKIHEDDDLYMIMGKKALENYKTSLILIENNPDFYRKEENMEKNIKEGISTLNELGFF